MRGRKTGGSEIRELYAGLQQSRLNDFDMLLTGYIPTAEGVRAVGEIAHDLKRRAAEHAGSFFWGKPVPGVSVVWS